jgi:phosphoribosyl 1,2-cyclic phosphate phosphodiesterase
LIANAFVKRSVSLTKKGDSVQVTFLGTAAAPSMPNPFCICEVCVMARRIGGKNMRRRSSILVNDDLLIDIGPDTATASFTCGVSFAGVQICLLTHSHEDHFDPEFIMARHADYGTAVAGELLLAASVPVLEAVDSILARRCEYGSIFALDTQAALGIKLLPLAPFEACQIGDYRVIGSPANHGKDQGYLLYAVERGGQAIFYGTDTSIFFDEVWDFLLRQDMRYDLVVLDQTYGIGFDSNDHLASGDVAAHAERFRREGLLKDNAAVYVTHISHEGYLEHDEFDAYAAKRGYRVAYDGLKVDTNGQRRI